MDRDPLLRQILLGSVLVHDPGRQDRDLGMGFHILNHPAEQGRLKRHVRIHDQMVFALEVGEHRVVGTAEADVALLRQDGDAGEKPLDFFGGHILRGVVRQVNIHIQIRVLNTPKGVSQFVPAVIKHQAGRKN